MLCAGALTLPLSGFAKDRLTVLKPDSVIVFQGDSITDGGRWRDGSDYNHIMGQAYDYIIAAQVGYSYPERRLVFINRGIGGDTVVNLAARWQADTIDLKPDVLSIMVGVNDTLFSNGETVETYEAIYDKLIADTLRQLPNVKIVLGEPFLLPVGNQKADYATNLSEVKKRQAAVARIATKYHLPIIHYQAAFDKAMKKAPAEHWSWDGVHPTYAGHGLMAREWLRTVNSAW